MPDDTIENRIKSVKERIAAAARSCGRDPEAVKLVAVSKTFSADRVLAAVRAGMDMLGENYVQEAREKINALAGEEVSWHLIGHLQTNKAKYAVKLFDLIHSVDSLKLARELNKRANAIKKVQKVLVQVNISREETKSGIEAEHTLDLIRGISGLENIAVHGLMTMPPFCGAPEMARPYFRALKGLQDRIAKESIPNIKMEELSMGMTGDFETAIQEGATMVRIGTAVFGERD